LSTEKEKSVIKSNLFTLPLDQQTFFGRFFDIAVMIGLAGE